MKIKKKSQKNWLQKIFNSEKEEDDRVPQLYNSYKTWKLLYINNKIIIILKNIYFLFLK